MAPWKKRGTMTSGRKYNTTRPWKLQQKFKETDRNKKYQRIGVPVIKAWKDTWGKPYKSIHQRVKNFGGAGSMSSFYYGKRRVPKGFRSIIKGLSKNYKVYNSTSRVASAVGAQAVDTLTSLYNVTEVNAQLTAITANKTQKILLQSVTAVLEITNQTLSNVRVMLYDIIARRDLSAANVANPDVAWRNSYADEGGANANWAVVGTTPFSSDLFTQYFKVLKVTHLSLGQGQLHSHRIHFQPNRVIDGEYMQYQSYGMKGLSCFTMVVAYGQPENDSTTVSQISTGSVSLDTILRRQYKYTFTTDSTTTYSVTNNLPATFTVGSHIIDEGSGLVVADASA